MATIAASRAPAGLGAAPAPAPDISASHPYTCNTCQVAFRNSDLQRGHMRSDWHRYNLKRRVTALPPIASEVFAEKVIAAQATSNAAATRAAYEKTCTACEKTYFSENAYFNHVGSSKHRSQVAMLRKRGGYTDDSSSAMSSTATAETTDAITATADSDSEEEQDSEEEEVVQVTTGLKQTTLKEDVSKGESSETKADVPVNRCLFCNYESSTTLLSVIHMEKVHGMFIPERNYLVDLDGLIGCLYEKINEFHECLYCGKLKPSIFGLQTHMRDKGHCKIPFETEEQQLEIGEFYDFRGTYSDEEDDESEDEATDKKASGGVKLGARRQAKIGRDDDEEMEDGEGWETDSSESSLDSDDLTAVPLPLHEHQYEKLPRHPHHGHDDPRPHKNADGYHSHAHKHSHAAFYSDYELYLPSGRTAGHRSLAKYYKQNLVNHPSPAERQERYQIEAARGSDYEEEVDERTARRDERERGRAMVSRANGGLGMMGVTAEKRKEVATIEKRARKQELRDRRKFDWGNNKQGNSQKHFRDPLLQ